MIDSQILELLANELDELLLDFHSEYPYIVAGGAVGNSLLNLMYGEKLPINDVDVFVFDNLGTEDFGFSDLEFNMPTYEANVIFAFLDIKITVHPSQGLIQPISIKTPLLDHLPLEVVIDYFLKTFPENATQISYNPQTRQFQYTKFFGEFVSHRQLLLNPITRDQSLVLYRLLKKHDEGVGHLSSNYIRFIYSNRSINPPSPKYLSVYKKLLTYPFFQDRYYLKGQTDTIKYQFKLWTKETLLTDRFHERVAFANEARFYNEETKQQALKIIKLAGMFYTISTVVDPGYFRKKIEYNTEYLNDRDVLGPMLILNDTREMFRLLSFVDRQPEMYYEYVFKDNLYKFLHLGVSQAIVELRNLYNQDRSQTEWVHEVKSYAELAYTSDYHVNKFYRGEILYNIGNTTFQKQHFNSAPSKIYKTDPKLYFLYKLIVPGQSKAPVIEEASIPF